MACASGTTTGTILTVPAGIVWSGELFMSASVALAATATPSVTVSGTGANPDSGTVVHRLSLTGLALTTVHGSGTISIIVVAPPGNAVTLEFATGGATSATIVANGFFV